LLFQVDLTTLRQISIESGLINHGLRKKVWPKLLAIDVENTSHFLEENYSLNADSDQVRRDIDRSLWKFTYGNAALRLRVLSYFCLDVTLLIYGSC